MNLPIAFEKKMRELLGAEFNDYIKCYEEKRLYVPCKYKKNQCRGI